LRQALPCDLYILDEPGLLEFDNHEGWATAFDVLAQPEHYRLAIVIVRPEYLDIFLRGWPQAEKIVLHAPVEIDDLSHRLIERFWIE